MLKLGIGRKGKQWRYHRGYFDLVKVLTPLIPLFSKLLGSSTFNARAKKLQERKAVAEERLGVLRVSECLTLVERAEKGHLMAEVRECDRKLVALYYGYELGA